MAHLPQTGRWQLVDPRITAGLLGGEGPPFGMLEVDFSALRGTARWWIHQAPLSNIAIDKKSHNSFSAQYSLRGKSGAFRAQLRDDGELEMDFYQGPPILKCRAVPRGAKPWQVKRMAVLTCVGNPGWPTGPGHGALIGDSCVYTFERVNVKGSTSGWKVMQTTAYLALAENLARPIVIQELTPSRVDFAKVCEYIDRSTREDEDFITSGWCSLQSAAALAVGISSGFDPRGLNTPRAVHDKVKSLNLSTKTYRVWDSSKTPAEHVPVLTQELTKYYPGVGNPVAPDVRDWPC